MDSGTLNKWKQLANDSIIASFGRDDNEARLATALENCLDELDYIADECEHCKTCPTHGGHEDDSIPIDANEIIRIHGELKKQVQAFKNLHVEFTSAVAEGDIEDLIEKLVSQIEEMENCVDELEAETLP